MPIDSINNGSRIPTTLGTAPNPTQAGKETASSSTVAPVDDSFATVTQRHDPLASRDQAPALGAETSQGSSVLNTRINNYLDTASVTQINWTAPSILPPSGIVSKPRPEVLQAALKAYDKANERGLVRNQKLTVIDYSLPSTQARLWVVDMGQKKLFAQHLVAHGRNSGDAHDIARAASFSNRNNSNQSSLGVFTTAETYSGSHGYSLRLDGQESADNTNARMRAIVMHGADYATQAFIERNGYLGRSLGCPAIDPSISHEVIDAIKGNSVIFAYADDEDYLRRSDFLS
jgi:hypothetical protein